MGRWRWTRLAAIVTGTAIGLGGGYWILANDTPRWMVAFTGLLLIGGLGCAAMLALVAWMTVVEDIRPRFVARRPASPLSLNTELSAMVGTRRFSTHPVRFWSGLILNHRVFFGLLLFEKAGEAVFSVSKDAA